MELGILIHPMKELVASQGLPDIAQYRIASAKIQAGDTSWRQTARNLATFADDLFMNTEFQRLSHVVEVFLRGVSGRISAADTSGDLETLKLACAQELKELEKNFYSSLATIPIDWEPEIFAANTPFTAYLKIKEVISSANSRIHYFDRYLKANFFELFLKDTSRSLEIRLATTQGGTNYGVRCVSAVSELARVEFTDYKLIEVTPQSVHDRNLRIDNKIFTLGPSIDQAGVALTNFGPTDSSVEAHEKLDAILTAGNVVHQS
jgi:hypothetical protein